MAGRNCSCGRAAEPVVVHSSVTNSDVELVVCAGCDRRCCTACGTREPTGRADRCKHCGAPINLAA